MFVLPTSVAKGWTRCKKSTVFYSSLGGSGIMILLVAYDEIRGSVFTLFDGYRPSPLFCDHPGGWLKTAVSASAKLHFSTRTQYW
jgi:hypothetical protein